MVLNILLTSIITAAFLFVVWLIIFALSRLIQGRVGIRHNNSKPVFFRDEKNNRSKRKLEKLFRPGFLK